MPRCSLSLQYARVALQKEMYSSTLFDSCKYLWAAPGPPVSAWLELPTANTLNIQPPHPSVPQSFL
ncbi:IscU protein [Giardia duodenalis]|uniref:IscU protein n=1 Tax=Giardia intestinalis TaxID=5741 RepID=V6U0X5_GIAIN|nr:IscU protein [Giardia intestinalis]